MKEFRAFPPTDRDVDGEIVPSYAKGNGNEPVYPTYITAVEPEHVTSTAPQVQVTEGGADAEEASTSTDQERRLPPRKPNVSPKLQVADSYRRRGLAAIRAIKSNSDSDTTSEA